MNIIATDTSVFKEDIKELLYIIENKNLKEQLVALSSLETILIPAARLDASILNFDFKILKQKKHLMEIYEEKRASATKKYINNFYENIRCHQDYLSEILIIIGNHLQEIDTDYRTYKTSYLKNEVLFDILKSYLKSINKEEILNKMIEEKRIFEIKELEGYNGEAINIINNKHNYIFLEKFDNTIFSLTTLVHELGHIIDFEKQNNIYGIKDINNLGLLSIYNEVISKKYEKDFLHYLIENNLYKKEAIDILIDLYWNDYDNMFSTYILSFLPKKIIEKEKYRDLAKKEIIKFIPENMYPTIEYIENLDFSFDDVINYSYGAIISECLTQKNIDIFYEGYRHKLFDPHFILENDCLPENFEKIYQKKLNILK